MKIKSKPTIIALTSILAIPAAHSANLALLFETAGVSQLGIYDTDNPGVAPVAAPIAGLGAGETLNAIDYRANGGGFYAISSASNVYTVSVTGAPSAIFIGAFSPALAGAADAFDFNPNAAGGILSRIISSDSQNNRVLDSTTGAYFGDPDKTAVFFPAGDANDGVTPSISHIAYDNNILGASTTQQFGIDVGTSSLVTVANNAGTLGTVAPLTLGGNPLSATAAGGFDIDGADGVAYAGFSDGTQTSIYTVDLTSGATTLVGGFAGNLVGLTTVPEPSSALLIGLAGLGLMRRKR